MKVVCDSSGCCGIKHIRDFYSYNNPGYYIKTYKTVGHSEDENTAEPPAYDAWHNCPAREWTAGEYFRYLVNQIKDRRPAGMITVNLVEEQEYACCDGCGCDCDGEFSWDTTTIDNWDPLLTELGFEKVRFRNSNSGNYIHHYTLIYDEEEIY